MSTSSKMWIRLWDCKKGDWDLMAVDVPGNPQAGPSNEQLLIMGEPVIPDEHGNFISNHYSEGELDAVHTFATAKLTIALWEKVTGQKIVWPCNNTKTKKPLTLLLDYPMKSARFQVKDQCIYFGRYGHAQKMTCQSFDTVSHEMTHAIIHALLPQVHKTLLFELLAIMEALADLTAIFTLLHIPEIYAKVFNDSSFDWSRPNFLSEFAESFGENPNSGIRSTLENVKPIETIYDASGELTSQVYRVLAELDNNINALDQLTRATLSPILNLQSTNLRSYWQEILRYKIGNRF